MDTETVNNLSGALSKAWRLIFAALLMCVLIPQYAAALSINVTAPDGTAVTDYRWLVEEDATKDSKPGVPADASNLSLNFHTSYMPVLEGT
jgi:hypothetical protein